MRLHCARSTHKLPAAGRCNDVLTVGLPCHAGTPRSNNGENNRKTKTNALFSPARDTSEHGKTRFLLCSQCCCHRRPIQYWRKPSRNKNKCILFPRARCLSLLSPAIAPILQKSIAKQKHYFFVPRETSEQGSTRIFFSSRCCCHRRPLQYS